MIVDTNSHTWSFLFNDQPYNSPHPLGFLNPLFYVNGINFRAANFDFLR